MSGGILTDLERDRLCQVPKALSQTINLQGLELAEFCALMAQCIEGNGIVRGAILNLVGSTGGSTVSVDEANDTITIDGTTTNMCDLVDSCTTNTNVSVDETNDTITINGATTSFGVLIDSILTPELILDRLCTAQRGTIDPNLPALVIQDQGGTACVVAELDLCEQCEAEPDPCLLDNSPPFISAFTPPSGTTTVFPASPSATVTVDELINDTACLELSLNGVVLQDLWQPLDNGNGTFDYVYVPEVPFGPGNYTVTVAACLADNCGNTTNQSGQLTDFTIVTGSANLITNGNFESGSIAPWQDLAGTATLQQPGADGTSNYGQMVADGTAVPQLHQQGISASAGDSMTVSFRWLGPAAQVRFVQASPFINLGLTYNIPASTTWQSHSPSFTVPNGANSSNGRLQFIIPSGAVNGDTYCVDEVTLVLN